MWNLLKNQGNIYRIIRKEDSKGEVDYEVCKFKKSR